MAATNKHNTSTKMPIFLISMQRCPYFIEQMLSSTLRWSRAVAQSLLGATRQHFSSHRFEHTGMSFRGQLGETSMYLRPGPRLDLGQIWRQQKREKKTRWWLVCGVLVLRWWWLAPCPPSGVDRCYIPVYYIQRNFNEDLLTMMKQPGC